MASLPDLPGGGYTVLLVCGFGLVLIGYYFARELRFKYHYRRGIQLFNAQNYQDALSHLLKAERLWMLRLSKQTMSSSAEDCRNLVRVLELISEAAGHCSLEIKTTEYRKAASEMERFFSNEKRSSRDYPKVYSTFAKLRKQFRIASTVRVPRTDGSN